MKKILTAIALTIAIPAVAQAQAAPAPVSAPKAQSEMKEKCDCCKDMAGKGMAGHDMKSGMNMPGHDMSKMQPGTNAPEAGQPSKR